MLSSAPLEGVALAEVVELPEADGVVAVPVGVVTVGGVALGVPVVAVGVVTVGVVTVEGVAVEGVTVGVPVGVPVGEVVGGKVRGGRPTQLMSKAKASNDAVGQVPENEIKWGL